MATAPVPTAAAQSAIQYGWRATNSSSSPAVTRAPGRPTSAGEAPNAEVDEYGAP